MNPLRRVGQQITDLFAHPGGMATRPMARVLNVVNRSANQRVASALGLQPGQRVLEVGFGGGAAIAATTSCLGPDGVLLGVDLSSDMARHARFAFSSLVAARRLELACADVAALPIDGGAVDHAYAMHSHLYWPAPLTGIGEIHRVLRPGGRVLLAMDVALGIRLIKWFGPEYQPADPARLLDLLREAGFLDVTTTNLTRGVVAVIGTRP